MTPLERDAFGVITASGRPAVYLFGLTLQPTTLHVMEIAVTSRVRAGARSVTLHQPDGTRKRIKVEWDLVKPALYGPADIAIIGGIS